MAGEINLEVVADIAKAKAGLAELTASLKNIEKATGETAKKSSALHDELQKAGKAFGMLGKSSVALAGFTAIKQVIQWTKEWESGLADVGKRQREAQMGMLSLAQAMPKKIDAAGAALLTRGLMQRGAQKGLTPEDTQKVLAATFGKMKGAGFADTNAAGEAAIDLVAAGVDPEQAVKMARSPGRRQAALDQANMRQQTMLAGDTSMQLALRNRQAKALAGYEQMFPGTPYARKTMTEAQDVEYRRTIEEAAARRAGYVAKEGEGFGVTEEFKQVVGSGEVRNLFNGRPEDIAPTAGSQEAGVIQDLNRAADNLNRASRSLDSAAGGGTR